VLSWSHILLGARANVQAERVMFYSRDFCDSHTVTYRTSISHGRGERIENTMFRIFQKWLLLPTSTSLLLRNIASLPPPKYLSYFLAGSPDFRLHLMPERMFSRTRSIRDFDGGDVAMKYGGKWEDGCGGRIQRGLARMTCETNKDKQHHSQIVFRLGGC
jgi:hypothetical protein